MLYRTVVDLYGICSNVGYVARRLGWHGADWGGEVSPRPALTFPPRRCSPLGYVANARSPRFACVHRRVIIGLPKIAAVAAIFVEGDSTSRITATPRLQRKDQTDGQAVATKACPME